MKFVVCMMCVVGICSLALAEEKDQPDCCGKQAAQVARKHGGYAACVCPQFPIEDLGDDVWVFYENYYPATPCDDESTTADALQDTTTFPQTCVPGECDCGGFLGVHRTAANDKLPLPAKKDSSFVPNKLVGGSTIQASKTVWFRTKQSVEPRIIVTKLFLVEIDFNQFPFDRFSTFGQPNPTAEQVKRIQKVKDFGRRHVGVGYEVDAAPADCQKVADANVVQLTDYLFVVIDGLNVYIVRTTKSTP